MPRSAPTASSSVRRPPFGKSFGWLSAKCISELSLGPNTSPLPSGVPIRSRGIDTMDTVWPTGSSDATIIVSVRFAVRLPRLSEPTMSTFTRSPSPGTGPALAPRIVDAPRTSPVKMRSNVSPRIVP